MTRDDLLHAAQDNNVQAFLRVIRQGESSQDDDTAYRTMFGGELFDAPPWKHPNKAITKRGITSTAAGAYQFLYRTWNDIAPIWGLDDFSPANQDLGAVALLHRCRAIDPLLKGDLDEAIRRANRTWASLPGSPYGQGGISLATCREVFAAYGGVESPPVGDRASRVPAAPTNQEVKPMAPLVLPLLEIASNLIPQLGKLFGPGTEVSNRNVAAAGIVADSLVKATEAVNLQDAVERIQNDPQALQAAKQAVSDVMFSIGEAGGGGIAGARAAALAGDQPPLYRRGDFLISLALFALVCMLLSDVFFIHPDRYSDNLLTQIVTAILVIIGLLGGYWLGSTSQSSRKTELLANK